MTEQNDGRPREGGHPKENRSGTSMHDATDNLQPVSPELVAYGSDPTVRPLGQAVLREVGDYLRIKCPPTAKEIVKRCTPWDWLTADKEWSVPASWKGKLAADLREAGYEVQLAGSVVPARSRRPTLPECPNEMCRAPFRIGTPLPVFCSAPDCGTYVTEFHYYDPDR